MHYAGMMRACALFAVAALSSGCMRVHEPEVRLAGVRLAGIGLTGGTLQVRLQVVNPNRFALRSDGLTYDLALGEPGSDTGEWIQFAQGTFPETLQVPARDSAIIDIPVEFSYRGVGGALRSLLDTGSFRYRISGVVHVTGPVRRDLPYQRRGVVTLDSM
jgi:LEA14-like dessication related protein